MYLHPSRAQLSVVIVVGSRVREQLDIFHSVSSDGAQVGQEE